MNHVIVPKSSSPLVKSLYPSSGRLLLLSFLLLIFQMNLRANNIAPPSVCSNLSVDEIAGNVFDDEDFNGILDGELGVAGITVNIYDGGVTPLATTVTDANGDYSFTSLDASTTYRVEFVIPSSSPLSPTPAGAENGSTIQFVTPGNCASLGLADINLFCSDNPTIVTTCYIKGLANGEAIVTNNYDLDGTSAYPCDAVEVGSTFGLAYQRSTEIMYTAAFVKSKVGLGSEGIDAIYMIDPIGGCFKDAANTHFNLSDFGCDAGTTPPICGSSPSDDPTCRDLLADPTSPTYDTWGWNNTFKTGLGDIDISTDGNTLYVMNLEARELVVLDVSDPSNVSLINKIAVPNPGCGGANDYRPFATKVHEGEVFIGITCTAESSQLRSDLKAFVYKLNSAGTGFVQVAIDGTTSGPGASDHIRLDYDRSGAFDAAFFADGDFQPWTDDPADYDVVNTYLTRPMPLLTDIEFDNDGSMMLAFANRDAYTVGVNDIFPGGPATPGTPALGPLVAGELLRVCNTGSGFVLEGGNSCPSNMSGTINLGPGGGEFYWGETAAGIHHETTMGALAMLPGSDRLVMTFMDPGGLNTGGLHTLSNTTGSRLPFAGSQGLVLYANGPGEFAKGAGLGDLEIVCPLPPIQVGNYVWIDTDGDGIQDPNEAPANGFTVKLYSKPATGNPMLLGTTTTGTDGSYYFSVDPGTDYFLVFCGDSNDNGTITFGGTEYIGTLVDQGASDVIDSDATTQDVAGTMVPAICFNSGSVTNHSYDFGLLESAVDPASVGNYTFLDCNENGIQDMGDSPLANVPVSITGPDGTFTTTSDDDGFYEFTELTPGDYTINFGFPAGLTGLMYTSPNTGGNDAIDSDADGNGDTGTFTLVAGENNVDVDAGYKDIEAPTFGIMAMDEEVECDGAGNTAALNAWLANNAGATATDNLTSVTSIVWANNFTALSNGCGATGSAVVEFTATDECGNTATTTATFTIVDNTPPTLVIPANVTIECDELTTPNNTGMATATDDCSTNSPVVTFSDVSTQGMGCSAYSYTIIRTWMATDDCNNTSEESQTITVEDNNPPMIAVPADITVECDQPTDPGATGNAVASNDNCATDSELTVTFVDVSTQTATGCGNDTYMITRTWTASDPCGNIAVDVQIINVEDTTPPTIFGPADITIECDESTDPSNTGSATGVDNCTTGLDEVVITFTDVSTQTTSGCGQYNYTITRTWQATDACGNSSTTLQTIEVEDTTPPEITCPANVTIECDESTDPSNTGFATSPGDNCSSADEIIITSSDISTQTNSGCGQYQYTITRTWQATDACDNSSTCVQIIEIEDTTAPVISCPSNMTLTCFETVPSPYTNAMDFVAAGGTVSDNCTATLPEFTVFATNDDNGGTNCPGDARVVVRTYFVQDACGNTSTCTQTFTYLESTQGPVITSVLPECYKYCADQANPMESDITYETDCSFGATVSITGPVVIGQENCPGSILRYTYTVTDDCGRTSAPVTRDFIIGNDGPTITCPPFNLFLECGDPNNADYIEDHIGTVTANTSCELGYTLNHFPQNFNNIACASSTVVTFVATDACGRTASCTTTISIMDNTPPVFTDIPPSVCDEIDCSADLNYWFNHWIDYMEDGLAAEDDCDSDVSISAVNANLNTDCGSSTVVTFVATDNCGNETEITGTFTVLEEQQTALSGLVTNEAGDRVGEVMVTLSGNNNFTTQYLTDEEGAYVFEDLPLGENYSIRPELTAEPLNGISSFDLYLMTKHVVEEQLLDSPYKMIAADVNKSGSVTTADLLELRQLILHSIDDFETNDSWAFVAADYVFADANNPFASLFPEEVLINGLSADEVHDFVAVKVGDVNGTATTNGLLEGDSRDFKGDLILATKDQNLVEGQSYEVSFRASKFTEIVGYQFSLNFDANVLDYQGLRAGALTNLSAANFGLSKLSEGVITSSWHNKSAVTIMDETPLFRLRFTAKADGLLSEALSISSDYTVAEAYGKLAETNAVELLRVDFRFDGSALATDRYILHQNNPNPFHDQTLIGFNLPEATTATLNIYNVKGTLVKVVEGDYEKGYHSIEIAKSDLGATGLFYYHLVTPKWSQTKKMTLIKW